MRLMIAFTGGNRSDSSGTAEMPSRLITRLQVLFLGMVNVQIQRWDSDGIMPRVDRTRGGNGNHKLRK